MKIRDLVFVSIVLGGGLALTRGLLVPATVPPRPAIGQEAAWASLRPVVEQVDSAFHQIWGEKGLRPAARAPELAVMRRLALGLTGSVPALEEIRRFEALPAEGRLELWVDELLRDRRTSDYLSERFARALVGTEEGPFLLFRRRRFTTWLSDALLDNRPWDALVRELISEQGLWTDHPATNFVSVTFHPEIDRPDPERLAARVARAFLGIRLDCAQCHDHPFQRWKQADFRGLAAFFGGVSSNLRGIRDGENTYRPPDRKTAEPEVVTPTVPFLEEWLPAAGTDRQRLAAWVTHPANPQLARVTVNRMWAILFGRPLEEPLDDLPEDDSLHPALDLLARDLVASGYNLHRLIRIITATEAFRIDSLDPVGSPPGSDPIDDAWASFPLTRLRPEQVAGALFQAAALPTLGPHSPWLVRLVRSTESHEFVQRYGDTGEDEFAGCGTIPQRLLLMNGKLVREKTKDDLFNASSRIANQAPDDRKAVEAAYLTVLTRRPSAEELDHFASRLEGTTGETRRERLTDLFWTLLNSTEFSWNH